LGNAEEGAEFEIDGETRSPNARRLVSKKSQRFMGGRHVTI
jgi:hypothetical protein